MKITARTLEIAVLDLFSRYGIHVGGRLLLADVESAWSVTGLRRADLVDGLGQLIHVGAVKLVSEGDEVYLELTARGDERMNARRGGPRELWEESRSMAILRRAQMRRREPAPGSGRRAFDAPAVSSPSPATGSETSPTRG